MTWREPDAMKPKLEQTNKTSRGTNMKIHLALCRYVAWEYYAIKQGSVEVDAFGGVANCFFLVPELFWFLRATDLQSFEIHGWAFFFHTPRTRNMGTLQTRVLRLIPLPRDASVEAVLVDVRFHNAFLCG